MTLKQARIIAGLTQEEAAKKIGVTRVTFTNWESGRSSPNITNKSKISKLFGVKIDDIVFFVPVKSS